jgi:fatty aldehyde decarbonylase
MEAISAVRTVQPELELNADSINTPDLSIPEGDLRYRNLLGFIVSNAIAGEIMAVDNYSEMVTLIPDTEGKIRTSQQSFDETKHIRQLAKLAARVGFPVKTEIVEPQWLAIRRSFHEAVLAKDLTSCYLMQDLMTESLAIVLYRTLTRQTDEKTRATAANILKDEEEHLEIGIHRVRELLARDPDHVHERLVWSHNQTIPQLFSMISTSCHSLCDVLGMDCGSLTLQSLRTDIGELRADATEVYVSTLERCEFRPSVSLPLIASIPN